MNPRPQNPSVPPSHPDPRFRYSAQVGIHEDSQSGFDKKHHLPVTIQRAGSHLVKLVLVTSAITIGCGKSTPSTKPSATQPKQTPAIATDIHPNEATAGGPAATNPFVGSAACSECHAEIADSYAAHPMGRSALALSSSTSFPPAEQSKFQADGFEYVMEQRPDNWVHRQTRDGGASDSTTVELPVSHVIGSGKNGQSFLVDHEGYLFMSPMTWYPAKGIWDLSPGYEVNNSQFNRPVVEECLYCHTDGANTAAHTLNRFRDPVVRAHAIGCERCHGPGQDHVAAMQAGNAAATEASIVNPASLSPELREAVCQQCHLSGAIRVLQPHRTLNDYVPGTPLHETYTIFTIDQDGKEFVGHVEQMYNSRCFQDSDGKLGCISCHDPHSLPSAEDKVGFYRDRCLNCHDDQQSQVACSLSRDARLTQSPQDNCVQCHMPQLPTEIRHAAVTDHTIPRMPRDVQPKMTAPAGQQVRAFPDASVATPRARSIALAELSARQPELLGRAVQGAVIQNLEDIHQSDAEDLDAADALVAMYLDTQRVEDAVQVCQQILAQAPQRESTLQLLAQIYSQTGQQQKAVPYWEQLLVVNPWMANYWYRLGQSYATLERWSRCKQLAAQGKQRFPTSIGLRHLLVQCHLALGDLESAEAEFREIESFAPPKFESLRQWYESHPLRTR